MTDQKLPPHVEKAIDEAVRKGEDPEELRDLVEALKDTLASLVAATSLLKRGSKKAAPSDTMFDMMVADYEKSIDRARTALTRLGGFAYGSLDHDIELRKKDDDERRSKVRTPGS